MLCSNINVLMQVAFTLQKRVMNKIVLQKKIFFLINSGSQESY